MSFNIMLYGTNIKKVLTRAFGELWYPFLNEFHKTYTATSVLYIAHVTMYCAILHMLHIKKWEYLIGKKSCHVIKMKITEYHDSSTQPETLG